MLVMILAGLGVLVGGTTVQLLLKVMSRRDSPGPAPRPLEWEDSAVWMDWTTNVLVAFGVLVLTTASDSSSQLGSYRVGVLLTCAVLALGVLPAYIRWVGIDPATGKLRLVTGILASNIFAFVIIVTAIAAGVDFL